ncbi:MAG: ATP synthase F0 subunit C [Clostridiales bacterium]|nr:ATP synthase F0 subunit C [Clostridiales bacterium]
MDPMATIIIVAHVAAIVALLNGIVTPFGQSKIALASIEAIARQPAASGSITSTMFIGCAMVETNGIYGLLIAIILLFANPLISIYMQYLSM